jgi:hypothetical protein
MVVRISLVVSGCGSTLASLYALLGVWGISIPVVFSHTGNIFVSHMFSLVFRNCVTFYGTLIALDQGLLLRKTAGFAGLDSLWATMNNGPMKLGMKRVS